MGKYTIPVLWDKKLNTIVNNESSDISYMLNSSFNEFSQNPELDLYTEDDEDGLDRLNEVSQWLYPRTSQEMEVASGVSMFSPNNDQSCEGTQNINYRDGNHFREPPPQSSHHPMFSEEDFLDGHQEYIESQYPDRTINQ